MTTDTMREVLQAAFNDNLRWRKQHDEEAAEHDEAARNNREIAVIYALKMHEIAEAARKLGIELDVLAPMGEDYVPVVE